MLDGEAASLRAGAWETCDRVDRDAEGGGRLRSPGQRHWGAPRRHPAFRRRCRPPRPAPRSQAACGPHLPPLLVPRVAGGMGEGRAPGTSPQPFASHLRRGRRPRALRSPQGCAGGIAAFAALTRGQEGHGGGRASPRLARAAVPPGPAPPSAFIQVQRLLLRELPGGFPLPGGTRPRPPKLLCGQGVRAAGSGVSARAGGGPVGDRPARALRPPWTPGGSPR